MARRRGSRKALARREIPNVVGFLRRIQAGEVNPRDIPGADRLNIVEHLRMEGYTLIQIAEILHVNEKTIGRDLERIRRRNAVEYDPRFLSEMVGRSIQTADSSIQHLRRRAREPGHSLMEVTLAEQTIWKIHKELVEKMQDLGYLPNVPTQIQGDLRHTFEVESDAARAEVQRLQVIGAGISPEAQAALDAVKKMLAPTPDQDPRKGGIDASDATPGSA